MCRRLPFVVLIALLTNDDEPQNSDKWMWRALPVFFRVCTRYSSWHRIHCVNQVTPKQAWNICCLLMQRNLSRVLICFIYKYRIHWLLMQVNAWHDLYDALTSMQVAMNFVSSTINLDHECCGQSLWCSCVYQQVICINWNASSDTQSTSFDYVNSFQWASRSPECFQLVSSPNL